MKWFRGISTQARITLLVSLLAVVAAVNALLGLNQAAAFQEQLSQLEVRAQALRVHDEALSQLLSQQVALKNALLDPAYFQQYGGDMARRQLQLENYLYSQKLRVENETQVAELAQLTSDFDTYRRQVNLAFSALSNPESADAVSLENVDITAGLLEAQLHQRSVVEQEQISAIVNEIDDSVQARTWLSQIALLLVAVLVVWGMYTTADISGPLRSLTSAVVAFENNLYRPSLVANLTGRKDELGELARAVDGMATSITRANQQKELFLTAASRFVPAQYLEFLEKKDITQVKLGEGIQAEMAVMFSDIRGFTTMSEKMTAKENFDFVNEYLQMISPLVQAHEGFVVKFLGDGMMAIFPYGALDAVLAGIDKQKAVREFNDELTRRGWPNISVGIGIHTGPMMVGMIGEELRMQGDAFSDNVNLTSRLEGLNKFYGTSMIISQDILDQLPQPVTFRMRYLGKAVVKGRVAPLALYEVYEGLPPAVSDLRHAAKEDFERGIALYTKGHFAEAGQAFQAVVSQDATDKTAHYYLERCAEWLGQPAPQNWDGVIVMDAK